VVRWYGFGIGTCSLSTAASFSAVSPSVGLSLTPSLPAPAPKAVLTSRTKSATSRIYIFTSITTEPTTTSSH